MYFLKRKFAALSLLALAILFTSCEEEDSNVGVDYNTIKIDFESVELPEDGVLGGKDANGSHEIGIAKFKVTYNAEYDVSGGVIISNHTDTETAGYTNSYSVYAGSGADGSSKFAIVNPFMTGDDPLIQFTKTIELESVDITNTTYAALSMMNGDQFAKKFSSEDEDFFKVILTGYLGENETGIIEAYLADFRNGSNSGILSTWETVDLSSLGAIDGIQISLESSDVGDYGMNTPSYVAIDNLIIKD